MKKLKFRYILLSLVTLGLVAFAGYNVIKDNSAKQAVINSFKYQPNESGIKDAEEQLGRFQEQNKFEDLKTNEDKRDYYVSLASIQFDANQKQVALETLQKAGSLGVKLNYSYYTLLGNFYVNLGQTGEANRAYLSALEEIEKENIDEMTKQAIIIGLDQKIEATR